MDRSASEFFSTNSVIFFDSESPVAAISSITKTVEINPSPFDRFRSSSWNESGATTEFAAILFSSANKLA
jgi:hypothetical protein